MSEFLHQLILRSAQRTPHATALCHKDQSLNYAELAAQIMRAGSAFLAAGIARQQRIAIYLPKCFEAVIAIFGASFAGAVFVPINPLLKPEQVAHILRDCNVRLLLTSQARAQELAPVLLECADLHTLVLIDSAELSHTDLVKVQVLSWAEMLSAALATTPHRVIDTDMAAILYTSGSTGKPKGVVLSQRNMLTGAKSVAQYLNNVPSDRLLAVLPLSFDYGFSQLSTAFLTGACAVLMDYLLPRDVIRTVERQRISGLAGVPSLWVQLAQLPWPAAASEHLRYITNSGGAMPQATLSGLRSALPRTEVFLMYGLTEAFRSTYLPPDQLDARPDSMGRAIPNAEISIVREDGTPCADDEPGELVHRGSLVALGYWNDIEKTAERFRPAPNQDPGLVLPEIAVWSGDTVRRDRDGYLYFMGRRDDMIKTSGYRVSPSELEDVLYSTGLVAEVSAIGVKHATLGQAIVLAAVSKPPSPADSDALIAECKRVLPNFMVPTHIVWRDSLPRNPNGKIDRKRLSAELHALFQDIP